MKWSHGQWFWHNIGTTNAGNYAPQERIEWVAFARKMRSTWHPERTLPEQPWETYERECAEAFGQHEDPEDTALASAILEAIAYNHYAGGPQEDNPAVRANDRAGGRPF